MDCALFEEGSRFGAEAQPPWRGKRLRVVNQNLLTIFRQKIPGIPEVFAWFSLGLQLSYQRPVAPRCRFQQAPAEHIVVVGYT